MSPGPKIKQVRIKNYVYLDFEHGIGFVQVNQSCRDSAKTDCKDALSLTDRFESAVYETGAVGFTFELLNSLFEGHPVRPAIKADITVIPSGSHGLCVLGGTSFYPSLEIYHRVNTSSDPGAPWKRYSHTVPQAPLGGYALTLPQRPVGMTCESTDPPGYQPPPWGPVT